MMNKLFRCLSSERGNTSIIFLIISTLFIGMMAFVVDAGMIYLEKSRLQNGVDAIALAAIQDFQKGESAMLAEAKHYAELNEIDPLSLQITISNNNKRITVVSNKKVDLFFAKLFNILDTDVQARASAMAGSIIGTNGIRPLAVEQQSFEFGKTYTLKKGAGDAYSGNYGALALGGTGSSNYRNNLKYGYNSKLEIGDLVRIGEDLETEPGNMAGPTYDGITYILEQDTCSNHDLTKLNKDCVRLILVPVVDSLDVNGRSTVKIVGFANFFLEDIISAGGHTEVKGKFIKTLGHGEIDESGADFGMLGVKLTE